MNAASTMAGAFLSPLTVHGLVLLWFTHPCTYSRPNQSGTREAMKLLTIPPAGRISIPFPFAPSPPRLRRVSVLSSSCLRPVSVLSRPVSNLSPSCLHPVSLSYKSCLLPVSFLRNVSIMSPSCLSFSVMSRSCLLPVSIRSPSLLRPFSFVSPSGLPPSRVRPSHLRLSLR